MTNDTDSTNLVSSDADRQLNVAASLDWFTDAPPPEMTPESIAALRSAFEDGDIVVVRWYDPRLASRMSKCTDENTINSVDRLSAGQIYELEDNAVWVQPFSPVPYSEDEVIAYERIRSIHPLMSGAETFSCYTSGRSQPVAVSRH
ncbi:MAG TPA: hypothetical protein VGU20_11955 [Stellaceae bacterium]|nr:hypothetical protein [Stellaceae bacterium]